MNPTPLSSPSPVQWASRDASWFRNPGTRGPAPRWHRVGKAEQPLCGQPTLLDLDAATQDPPLQRLRCIKCEKLARTGASHSSQSSLHG